MALAIFDLDNTLLAGDSDHAWGEFLVAQKLVDGAHYQAQNDQFYAQYQQGTLDVHDYLRFVLNFLTQKSLDELHRIRDEFLLSIIKPMIATGANALLDTHRQQGDTLLIITATNAFITAPIAALLKIEHIIAPEPEIVNQRYTGEIIGEPSFGEGKVTRLAQWLQQHPELASKPRYFYSDSHNDLPLLNQVDYPIAVDPDEILAQHANASDWPIISLRERS